MEIVREMEAARAGCDAEALRRSDESCVRMMEQYAAMGTELVHTYLGGLEALDRALERMPAPGFDTVGFGRAVNPALLPGADAAASSSGLRPLPPLPDPARPYVPDRALSWSAAPGQHRATPPSSADRYSSPPAPFGYGWNRWGVGPVDPYAAGRARGYSSFRRGYSSYAPPIMPAYGYDYDPRRGYGYGYDYAYGDGYDLRYRGGAPAWRDPAPYTYDPRRDRGRRAPGYLTTPRYYGYGFRYDLPIDPAFYGLGGYGSHYPGYDPYFGGGAYGRGWRDDRYYDDMRRSAYPRVDAHGRSAYDGPADGWTTGPGGAGGRYGAYPYDPYVDDGYDHLAPGDPARRPEEDWGYDGYGELEREEAVPSRVEVVAPRHAPGILLPPEERLRRPWIRD